MELTLPDHWQYSDPIPLATLVASKSGFVTTMLAKAEQSVPEEWFLNFTSAVGDSARKSEVAESHWIAVGAHSGVLGAFVHGMNTVVRKGFPWGVRRRYGVVAMDYPELPKDSDFIACLVGTNM